MIAEQKLSNSTPERHFCEMAQAKKSFVVHDFEAAAHVGRSVGPMFL
jgi:hypothetical protein